MLVRRVYREEYIVEPIELFKKTSHEDGFIWFDSSTIGAYSYILRKPYMTLSGADGVWSLVVGDQIINIFGDPFPSIDIFTSYDVIDDEKKTSYNGGAAGFIGYDLLKYCEPSTKMIARAPALEGDLWLGWYDRLIAIDHKNNKTWIVVNLPENVDPSNALSEMKEWIDSQATETENGSTKSGAPNIRSNFTREEYLVAVDSVREYIAAGDCYQANISQRFTVSDPEAPESLYLKLRESAAAPYSAWIGAGATRILSSSPESFLNVTDEGDVTSRPIKGTRPRSDDHMEDRNLADELLESDKDRAENIMIVDLVRNDLSRVCSPGSVKALNLCEPEKFSTVHHLTSTIVGRLTQSVVKVSELLKATFPCGSVTGAPKIRAMEIIDEIEPVRRGVYCGAIGWVGFDGALDLSVAIRVMAHHGEHLAFHVGGGVTWPSDADEEYMETLDKAKAIIEALGG